MVTDLQEFIEDLQRKFIVDLNPPKEFHGESFFGSVEAFMKSTKHQFTEEGPVL